jgi:hypothetical protein
VAGCSCGGGGVGRRRKLVVGEGGAGEERAVARKLGLRAPGPLPIRLA